MNIGAPNPNPLPVPAKDAPQIEFRESDFPELAVEAYQHGRTLQRLDNARNALKRIQSESRGFTGARAKIYAMATAGLRLSGDGKE